MGWNKLHESCRPNHRAGNEVLAPRRSRMLHLKRHVLPRRHTDGRCRCKLISAARPEKPFCSRLIRPVHFFRSTQYMTVPRDTSATPAVRKKVRTVRKKPTRHLRARTGTRGLPRPPQAQPLRLGLRVLPRGDAVLRRRARQGGERSRDGREEGQRREPPRLGTHDVHHAHGVGALRRRDDVEDDRLAAHRPHAEARERARRGEGALDLRGAAQLLAHARRRGGGGEGRAEGGRRVVQGRRLGATHEVRIHSASGQERGGSQRRGLSNGLRLVARHDDVRS